MPPLRDGKRPRNAVDRQIATPQELRAVIADFREAGQEAEVGGGCIYKLNPVESS